MTVMILIEWRSVVKSLLTLSTLTLYTDDRQTAQTVSVPRPFPHATPQKGICLCAATHRNRSCWWAWSHKTSLCADCCQCCPSFACCSPLGWYKKKAESRCKARWMDRGSSCVWQKMTTLGRSGWMHWKNLVREITWSGSQGRGFPLHQVLWDIDAESTNYLLVRDGEESVEEWLVAVTWMWRLWQSINRLIDSDRLKQLFDYSFPELKQHCRCRFDVYFLYLFTLILFVVAVQVALQY